ncbi:Transcription initiation factor TFIID subunit 9 [Lecanosticta acicola]|uniref:Transcription initiation factor TFIID subunit 9 n=1 Tax=Lecanosticta acicola TaxID=111012 RepID=A0AAI8YY83_9PEZI|nr:Transcription initiation factor TFIID subunit 9 [Lecanosticta acicola]
MATNGHPATPPPSDPSAKPEAQSKSDPEVPLTSTQDDGTSKRPRDARLMHIVLSSLGIHSYQERVPLQLLDFAYRYTSGVLSDSLRLSAEGYSSQNQGSTKRGGGGDDSNLITVTALRQAIASRQGHTFQGALPKEFMLEQAAERNRIALPKVERSYGVQLPPEKYCLTGVGWGLKDEWESEEDVPIEDTTTRPVSASQQEDETMGGMDGADEDEEGAGRMEDVFGESGGGDTTMAD